MKNEMTREIRFYFAGDDCHTHYAKVEITLENPDKKPVLSISGSIIADGIHSFGQCLDTIKEYVNDDPVFDEIYRLWELYHLNDMHGGTPEQEKALEDAVSAGKLKTYGANNYNESCDYLKSVNLYEVTVDNKPYKYGHSWLYEAIPDDDLNMIKMLITKPLREIRKRLMKQSKTQHLRFRQRTAPSYTKPALSRSLRA